MNRVRVDASVCAPADGGGLVMANVADRERLLGEGVIRPGPPDDRAWSSLEYACHVRSRSMVHDTIDHVWDVTAHD